MQEVSHNIAGVTEASSETRAASGRMLGAAGELSVQAATLRRMVDTFLARVRAAQARLLTLPPQWSLGAAAAKAACCAALAARWYLACQSLYGMP